MPAHARGAHYFGKIADFLKCSRELHQQIADKTYEEIQREKGRGVKSVECQKCGTTIVVSARGLGEWEVQEYPKRSNKESE